MASHGRAPRAWRTWCAHLRALAVSKTIMAAAEALEALLEACKPVVLAPQPLFNMLFEVASVKVRGSTGWSTTARRLLRTTCHSVLWA